MLGHTSEADFNDSELTPRNLREVEAEAVALLCCEALSLEGSEYCPGYIQEWLRRGTDSAIPEKSAQKILRVADQILKGRNSLMEVGRTQDRESFCVSSRLIKRRVNYGELNPTRRVNRDSYSNRA